MKLRKPCWQTRRRSRGRCSPASSSGTSPRRRGRSGRPVALRVAVIDAIYPFVTLWKPLEPLVAPEELDEEMHVQRACRLSAPVYITASIDTHPRHGCTRILGHINRDIHTYIRKYTCARTCTNTRVLWTHSRVTFPASRTSASRPRFAAACRSGRQGTAATGPGARSRCTSAWRPSPG